MKMDYRADGGTQSRLMAMSKDLAPIIMELTSKGGCLVGQCEKAVKDIKKVIDKKIKRNSIMWIALMFIEAIFILSMP
jgi:hypothetical protein